MSSLKPFGLLIRFLALVPWMIRPVYNDLLEQRITILKIKIRPKLHTRFCMPGSLIAWYTVNVIAGTGLATRFKVFESPSILYIFIDGNYNLISLG